MNNNEKLYNMSFGKVYSLYVKKVERKQRTEAELRDILIWFSGYSDKELDEIIKSEISMREFFAEAKI